MKGFIFLCSILAIICLINVATVIIKICIKKKSLKSIVQINPYKFYIKIFRNLNDGYGADVKAGIVPIICTVMSFIGLWSIAAKAIYWFIR